MISIMSFCLLNAGVLTIAHANTVGYILLMRRLYQLSKRPVLPMSRVKPEQKKNSTSPMLPPVANTEYLPYSNSMCELVMNSAARNFRISILTSRCLITSYLKCRYTNQPSFLPWHPNLALEHELSSSRRDALADIYLYLSCLVPLQNHPLTAKVM